MPEHDVAVQAEDDLELLRRIGTEAGEIAMSYFRADPKVWHKANDSPVSEADYAVDRFLKDALLKARPDHGWLSEETEADDTRHDAPRSFVVDPIDGTRGYLQGQKIWCVSIAIIEAGRPICGILVCPALGEIFEAKAGEGAWKNGHRLVAPSGPPEPLKIGGPAALLRAMPDDLGENNQKTRHIPSLAYRIAMVADGRLSAIFVRPRAHDWDVAAAQLVLSESGGRLVDYRGQDAELGRASPQHDHLLAAREPLLSRLLPILVHHDS